MKEQRSKLKQKYNLKKKDFIVQKARELQLFPEVFILYILGFFYFRFFYFNSKFYFYLILILKCREMRMKVIKKEKKKRNHSDSYILVIKN